MAIAATVVTLVTSVLIVLLVLAHRGTGGGISDMLGGGGAALNSSVTANKNLTRMLYGAIALWLVAVLTLAALTH